MNVLVVGASGYLGQEVFHQARAAGHNVTGTYSNHRQPGLVRHELGVSDPDELLGSGNFDAAVWTASGYRTGMGDFLLRAIVDDPSIRLIYTSSDAVTSDATLAHDGPLGKYARMKQAEEEIANDGDSLILRLGPMYDRTSKGVLDSRTRQMVEHCRHKDKLSYWDNAYKSFTKVTKVAEHIVANELSSGRHGTYLLGPDTKESYFEFYSRRARALGANTSLLSPISLDDIEAEQKGIGFDTSFHTHERTIALG